MEGCREGGRGCRQMEVDMRRIACRSAKITNEDLNEQKHVLFTAKCVLFPAVEFNLVSLKHEEWKQRAVHRNRFSSYYSPFLLR